MPKYKAVLFDLYDTLVQIDPVDYLQVKHRIATALETDPDGFLKAWRNSSKPAARGDIGTLEDRLRRVIAELGLREDPQLISQLASWERELQEQRLIKIPDCDQVLSRLAETGMRIVLVTNTSSVSKRVLSILRIEQWFDAIVFSFEHHLLKPDPEIYRKAASLVCVLPAECIFVGDGNDRELDGAKNVGMLAVRVATSRDESLASRQSTVYDHQIERLLDLIPLLDDLG